MFGARKSRSKILILSSVAALSLAFAVLVVPEINWRARVILMKSVGQMPDLTWGELGRYILPGSPYYLEPLVSGQSPYAIIGNQFDTPQDVAEGRQIFDAKCGVCHSGGGGQSHSAPDLSLGRYRSGDSDLAVYRTISRGISGSSMKAQNLTKKEIWQTVAYLKSLSGSLVDSVSNESDLQRTHLRVTPEQIRQARDHASDWLTYSGASDGLRFSQLAQVNSDNVKSLNLEWVRQGSFVRRSNESTPLVAGGIMYLTEGATSVSSLDASTGELLWRYHRETPANLSLCCGMVNRGVALYEDLVIVGTLDAHLIALESGTGVPVWDVEMADYQSGYSGTAAPLVVNDMVIAGIAGGEYGIRGFLDAYNAATGDRLWRFHTIPEPGQPGAETWSGDSWKTGGGPTWMTGSYDADLDVIYWGTGNPSPDFWGASRQGDNLYTNSVVALDADTGELRWFFQFTPHDTHDYDSNQVPLLAETDISGKRRQVLMMANKNGFFYVLDRQTGEFIRATPFARQNWATAIEDTGRPVLDPQSIPNDTGVLVYPSAGGATNWWPPAYSIDTRLLYLPVLERGSLFFGFEQEFEKAEFYLGGTSKPANEEPQHYTSLRAIDPSTGEITWEFRGPERETWASTGGVLATAGNILFWGDGTVFFALDAKTGRPLWKRNLGGQILAAPMTYAVDDRQFVTVAAGHSIYTFSLPES